MNPRFPTVTPRFPTVTVQLSGEDGNVFSIIGRISQALKRAGEVEGAAEFVKQAWEQESYDAVLQLAMRTVEVE